MDFFFSLLKTPEIHISNFYTYIIHNKKFEVLITSLCQHMDIHQKISLFFPTNRKMGKKYVGIFVHILPFLNEKSNELENNFLKHFKYIYLIEITKLRIQN